MWYFVSAGKRFAAKHSEVMFLPGLEPEKTKAVVDDMRYDAVPFYHRCQANKL